ncbi:GNAT family N-acetyltransferase [Acidovorax sp. NCPPB 3576]|uniref:GNAT family N-acetyltransferase n=1 Tax=Acidovorax sp. NCPPB 3576 TaxID=2940488 RepID=UPI00234A037D|nr:GNAT family protein [Acidovorax sp. NCPPB 3576]WCM90238.1 GNAT family N-acetyltransferase [Acidovorax sp. NCPPB 3576]
MTFFPTLETPRLRLRKMVASDAPALLSMHADAESRQWAGYNAIRDLEGALDFVNWADQLTLMPVPGFCWAIERKGVPGMIGQCNFTHCDATALSAALGYELASPYQGQGFMNEAIGRVLNWCFLHLQLMRISASVHSDNVSSIRMLQRWGFQCEGLLRSAGFWDGRHHDLLSFSLLATEFAPACTRQAQERSVAAAPVICIPSAQAERAEA